MREGRREDERRGGRMREERRENERGEEGG